VYTGLSVEDHLRFGAHPNSGWDAALAHRRIEQLDLDPRQKAGQLFTGPATSACLGSSSQACTSWLASKHLRQSVTYQPASRFWPLQRAETALYLVLAAGLGWLCVWRVRRRQSLTDTQIMILKISFAGVRFVSRS